jgi:hypothetical protein
LNSRAIDCKNQNICVKITNVLLEHNINNLDLGAFQINYKYHKLPIKDYFNLKTSYAKAEQIVTGHIKRYGYNLRAIANYHSKTPVLNKAYREKLRYYLD